MPSITPAAPTTLRDSEQALILQTLEAVGWVIGGRKGAAARLGLKRTTLIHRMKKLGIERPAESLAEEGRAPLTTFPGTPTGNRF